MLALLNYTIFHHLLIVAAAILSAQTSWTRYHTRVLTTAYLKHSHSKLIGISEESQEKLLTSTAISEFAWQMLPILRVNVQIILSLAQVFHPLILHQLHRRVDVVQSLIRWMSHSFIMLSMVHSPLSKKK